MDENSQLLTNEKKTSIMKQLVEALIQGVESGKVSLSEMRESANYILDHIAVCYTSDDMARFLEALSRKWPVYEHVRVTAVVESTAGEEKQIINKLSQYLASN